MAVQTEEVVEDVTVIAEDGSVEVIGDVTYDCTEVPYTMADNPGEIVVTDPNRDVLYPGAFIQGRTHRDGISIGDILPLTINERAPVRVSIPDVSNPDSENFREVVPNQAEIAEAIGNIVGNATRDDLHTPSSISFDMQSFHSESQFALQAGVSARYLGFKGSASGSVEKSAATTTVAVQFTQKMFTVVVEPPGAGPESFFAETFTADHLQTHVDAGRIGPDNLPIYVSSVVYGRMMTFAMTSTASESEIRAALRASYNSLAGGGSVELSAKHKSVLSESSVVLTTLGGDAADALGVIRSGDWSAYFGNEAALSTAVPLSYTFKNLGDNSIAVVSEASEYTVKTCEARQATPGIFEPIDGQAFNLGLEAVSEVLVADLDGDGYDDLVFNGRATDNEIAVLSASEDGQFRQRPVWGHPAAPAVSTWNRYQLQAGDIDGDGDDDLVWNHNGPCDPEHQCRGNTFYSVLSGSNEAGNELEFSELDVQRSGEPEFDGDPYPFHLADINGDGMADPIVQSSTIPEFTGGHFWLHAGLAEGDGLFVLADVAESEVDWTTGLEEDYLADVVADFTGDGKADILWSRTSGETDTSRDNILKAVRSDVGDVADLSAMFEDWGALELPPASPTAGGWENGQLLWGDLDADGATDVLGVWLDGTNVVAQSAFGGAANGLVRGEDGELSLGVEASAGSVDAHLADVAGNDRDDLIVNQREGAINRVFIGLSAGDGTFDGSPAVQEIVGDEAWSQFELIPGNFGGSDKIDLAWVVRTNETRVYVAIAR